ncbi:MAG: hypothetical protein L0Z62_07520, partial [Gemmataceae bacterium]|nr:hypothetical protein [Gemmataceae bacterium]
MLLPFTHELRQALAEQPAGPVRVTDPQTQQAYVLLREDLYERVKALLETDDFDVREMYPHMAKVFGPA